jgi:D-serine deaminase-like pyridoxal phosphate-dependent protein
MKVDEIDTPALLLDLDLMDKNIRTMSEYLKGKKAKLRPHVKNHKIPTIARLEIDAGAVGVAVAKLSEAEVMAWGGIKDILITNQIVTEYKIARLMNLAKHCSLSVAVDNLENVKQLSNAAAQKNVKIGIVVEIDVGHHRAGVNPGKDAVPIAKSVIDSRGLEFKGLMGYEGHVSLMEKYDERKLEASKSMQKAIETKECLEDAGINVEMMSFGGTGTYNFVAEFPEITEIQAGSYVTMDCVYKNIGVPLFECALSLVSTVTSRPTRERAVIDAGLKVLTNDQGLPELEGAEGITLAKLSAEHGHLNIDNPNTPLRVGERLTVLPSDTDTTINLHDRIYGIRQGEVEVIWPIAARGMVT